MATTDGVTIPVDGPRYLLTLWRLRYYWGEAKAEELSWFLASMRGDLPEPRKPTRNFHVVHIQLPKDKYYLALERLTTRLGVKL